MENKGRELTDLELQQVLERAAAIEQTTRVVGWESSDVEAIGAEVGIKPEAIRQALAELAVKSATSEERRTTVLNLSHRDSRTTQPVDSADLALLARVLDNMGRGERPAQYGPDHFSWRSPDGVEISVLRRGPVAEVSGEADLTRSVVSESVLMVVGGALIAVVLAAPTPFWLEAGLMGGASGGALGYGYWHFRLRQIRARVRSVVGDVTSTLRALADRE